MDAPVALCDELNSEPALSLSFSPTDGNTGPPAVMRHTTD